MHVLLVGSDNPIGEALEVTFSQWGRHRATSLTAAACRWRSERQAKKAARKSNPEVILDLRLAWLVASGEPLRASDLERSHWLAKACERSGIHYLLLSCDCVFMGRGTRSIRESDDTDAITEPGVLLRDAEERVLQAAPSAIVLRTGPVFASHGENMLTTLLHTFHASSAAAFDDRDVFCAVSATDVARVGSAMLDQLSVGADASGVYHYCSGDRTTAYGFAEVVLAAASQYYDLQQVVIKPLEEDSAGQSRVLDCSRLRDGFAIKQVPWRGFINDEVKDYYQAALMEETP